MHTMHMKKKTPSLVPLRTEFHRDFKEFFPVAHGTLSFVRKPCNNPNCRLCASGERHPAWTFVFRKDGKAGEGDVRWGLGSQGLLFISSPSSPRPQGEARRPQAGRRPYFTAQQGCRRQADRRAERTHHRSEARRSGLAVGQDRQTLTPSPPAKRSPNAG